MVAFTLFGFPVYWYGIFYLVSFILGYLFFKFLGKKKVFAHFPRIQNILDHKVDDLIIFIVLGVLVGGRMGHFFIYYFSDLWLNPLSFFKVWEGGMSFIGGMVGVTLSIILFSKINKLKLKDFLVIIDIILVVAPLGIMFGRFGNFLNQELYGLVVPSTFRGLSDGVVSILKEIQIFHVYSQIDNNLRVNTNFLSMLFEGLLTVLLLVPIVLKRIKIKVVKPGFVTGIFLLNYSFWRFLFEYLRQDSSLEFVGWFSKSQYFFVFFFLLGLLFLFLARKNIK